MAWGLIIIAGLFETAWAIGMKYSEGFTKLVPSIFTVVSLVVGFACLTFGIKSLPVGTAYAVWTGIGAAGTAVLGMVLFGEPATILRIASLALIIAGIIGLKFVS